MNQEKKFERKNNEVDEIGFEKLEKNSSEVLCQCIGIELMLQIRVGVKKGPSKS